MHKKLFMKKGSATDLDKVLKESKRINLVLLLLATLGVIIGVLSIIRAC
jgi:hypothetical protein